MRTNGEADEPVEAPPRNHTRGWFDRFPAPHRHRETRVTPSDDDASEASLRAPLGGAPAARSGTFARAMRVPLLAGGLLVFIDVMKELPMTLLLRPFNYETLATYVYQFAKDELLEEAALPALIIVAMGVLPVIVMNAALRRVARH